MIFVLSLTGCASAPQPPDSVEDNIPFETLAQGMRLSSPQSEPVLLMATNPAAFDALVPLLDLEHQALLNDVDFERNIILAVFWGVKPSGGYSITIDRIWTADNDLTVNVILNENDPTLPKVEASTYPYHLVIVDRLALPGEGNLFYQVLSDDAVLVSGELQIDPLHPKNN
jgi:hypothetical protein